MPNVFHVRSYLVCASCLKSASHKCGVSKSLHHFIVCNSLFSLIPIWKYCHKQAIFGISTNMSFYCASIILNISPNKCVITALRSFVKKLFCKMSHCLFCLCHNEQTTGVFIDSMNQSRSIIGV